MLNFNRLIAITLFITLVSIHGQTQQAVLTSGQDGNGLGGSVSYSIGQADYTNFRSDSGSVSLGVQQPLVVIMVATEDPGLNPGISLFPNPANNAIHLVLDETSATISSQHPSFRLYDINGKLLAYKEINDVTTTIPMEKYASGMYLIRITQNNSDIRTFKIFKTN